MYERFYRSLYRIRRVEEEIARVYPKDVILSPIHLSIGQEAISVGVCEALRADDVVFGSYRGHALHLAKGGSLKAMVAELYGKATGCARGKAGSMHLIDVAAGVMGASAVVATTIPHAVGYAWALRRRGVDAVVAAFFGDGAAEEGVFHESLNFAQLARVPVLFVCENNDYAIHSRQRARQSRGDICELARAHGLPAHRIEDMDTGAIYDHATQAVAAMRAGGGPQFLECLCYRWQEHVGPTQDFYAGYRHEAEAARWVEQDQVRLVGERLPAARRAEIAAEVEAEIADAFSFAEASPFPEPGELYTDLFK